MASSTYVKCTNHNDRLQQHGIGGMFRQHFILIAKPFQSLNSTPINCREKLKNSGYHMSPIRALVLDELDQKLEHITDKWTMANSAKLDSMHFTHAGLCHFSLNRWV